MTDWTQPEAYGAPPQPVPVRTASQAEDESHWRCPPHMYTKLQPATKKLIDATIYDQLANMAAGDESTQPLRHVIDTEPGLKTAEHTINFLRGFMVGDMHTGKKYCGWVDSLYGKMDLIVRVSRLLENGVPGASPVDVANLERFGTLLELPKAGQGPNAYLS